MILVTRPAHDSGTNYLYYWAGKVINEARKKMIGIIDLSKRKANRKEFASYIKKQKPSLVWINGHGSDDCVTGNDYEVLVNTSDKGLDHYPKIFVARSCRCGRLLGKFLLTKGTKAFIGYSDDYIIKTSNKYSTRPLLDPIAKLFLEASNYIVISLIKGHDVNESNERSKSMILNNLRSVLSKDSGDGNDLGRWLWHDYRNQIVLGKLDTRL